jgi:hypothetical protein
LPVPPTVKLPTQSTGTSSFSRRALIIRRVATKL